MNFGTSVAFSVAIFWIFILIVQISMSEDWLCNESSYQSWSSEKNQNLPKEKASDLITIKLYVREGGKSGRLLSGVSVDAKDDADVRYGGITSDGYLILKGNPGIWKFTISRDDFKPETVVKPIFKSGKIDINFSEMSPEPKQEKDSEISAPYFIRNSDYSSLISPFTADFDLRDMNGFVNNLIGSDEIESFIQAKASTSPMLNEQDIGECFVSAGLNNDVNPAFLVAVAYSESEFGTKGWAERNPESHNSLGYGIDSEDIYPNTVNSANSWCAMINRLAIVIAKGDNYYKRNLFSIEQVYTKYSKKGNLSLIVSLMNELYFFDANRIDEYAFQQPARNKLQNTSTPLQRDTIELSGYRPTYKPSQSSYKPTYIPRTISTAKETVRLG